MFKTYKYRLYPNKTEEKKLLRTLEVCRWTYNAILATRKLEYETNKKLLSHFDSCKLITKWKTNPENDFLKVPYAQVLQNVSYRVDLAYKSFFRRIRNGEKPGHPRFKGIGQYDSFLYYQGGYILETDSNGKVSLNLSKIGIIKLIYHRKIQGEVCNCLIRKTNTNKWYAVFTCKFPDNNQKFTSIENPIGVDCGLISFITLSNGEQFPIKKFFRKSEEKLKKLHEKVSESKNNTPERTEAKKRLSLAYEKTGNQRLNYSHHVSKYLSGKFDFIVFEDLNIVKMKEEKKKKFGKSVQDAAWNQLVLHTTYKAENAGKRVVLVNPAYTSQTCSNCGKIKKKSLSERWHNCECGLSIDRDENAAINILRLGMQSLEVPN